MARMETETELSPLEYAVYGVLAAAKRETGPEGARRLSRIQERLHNWDQEVIEALRSLIDRGWVDQEAPILGMVYYSTTIL